MRWRKPRWRKSVQVDEARPPTGQSNESRSIDFMANQLVGWQRHCPLIETTIWAKRVGRLTHFSKNPTNQYPRQGSNLRPTV